MAGKLGAVRLSVATQEQVIKLLREAVDPERRYYTERGMNDASFAREVNLRLGTRHINHNHVSGLREKLFGPKYYKGKNREVTVEKLRAQAKDIETGMSYLAERLANAQRRLSGIGG